MPDQTSFIPVPMLRGPENSPSRMMSSQVGQSNPNSMVLNAGQIGESAGREGLRGLFGLATEFLVQRATGRPGGSIVGTAIHDTIAGYARGRANRTALNARRGNRDMPSIGPNNNRPGRGSNGRGSGGGNGSRTTDTGGSRRGGNRTRVNTPPPISTTSNLYNPVPKGSVQETSTMRQATPNVRVPVHINPKFHTFEGTELPLNTATTDYVGQLFTYIFTQANWANVQADTFLPYLYNVNSLKATEMVTTFQKLEQDLVDQYTSKFTDTFTPDNLWEYIQDFTAALELLAHYYSVRSIVTSENYDDYMLANTRLSGWYGSWQLRDAMTRLEHVLKGLFYPPEMTASVYAFNQLYKTSNLPQACNFRTTPRDYLVLIETDCDTTAQATMQDTMIAEIEYRISRLTTRTAVYISKSIKAIRPGYLFTGLPNPSTTAVYDPNMYEHAINMTRVYLSKKTDNSITCFPALSTTDFVDRPYNLPLDVEICNSTIFALQSQMGSYTYNTAPTTDNVNVGSTFAKLKTSNGSDILSKDNAHYIDNFFSMVQDASGVYFWDPENIPDTMVSGRANILDWVLTTPEGGGTPVRSTDPTKFSITPPTCQRVYYNNRIAPVDAVTKLISGYWDTRL